MSSDGVAVVPARAKLNLFLDVVGRRPDGFHELVTVFHEVELADELRLRTAPTTRLRCDRDDVPTDERNLVVRALDVLLGDGAGAEVELRKRIPAGGGLGGGSSDAAATLRWARAAYGLDVSDERLAEIALELGSDVPFFLVGGTAVGRGRGERLAVVGGVPRLRFALFLPPFGVPTGPVFGALPGELDQPRPLEPVLAALRSGDPERVVGAFHNSLEPAAEQVEPRLGPLRRRLSDAVGRRVCMSGSGSTLFVPLLPDEPVPTAPEGVHVLVTHSQADA